MASPHDTPTAGPIGRRLSRRQVLQALGLGGATALGLGAGLPSAARGLAARQDLTIAPETPEAAPTAALPTVADKAAELQYDLERIFRFVADEIHYETYAGALRGPNGTLWGRSGNSVDQAQLLAALLDEALVPYRFVVGELNEAAATALVDVLHSGAVEARDHYLRAVAATGGVTGDAEPPALSPEEQALRDQLVAHSEMVADTAAALVEEGIGTIARALDEAGVALPVPPAPALPERERRQHVWIQYADGPLWVDLDPSIPSAAPGTAYATAGETSDALPDDLFHQVRIAVVAEEAAGGAARRRDVVAHAARAQDLVGTPVALTTMPASDFEGFGLALTQVVTGDVAFVPTLIAGAEGIAADVPIVFGTRRGEGGGGGLLDDLPGEDDDAEGIADGETLGLWLQVEIGVPDAPSVVVERTIMDRVDPAIRDAGDLDLAAIELSPVELVTLPDGATVYPPLAALTLIEISATRLPNTLALADAAGQVFLGETRNLVPSYFTLRDGIQLGLGARHGWWAYPNEPNVTAFTLLEEDLTAEDSPVTLQADLLHRALVWVPASEAATDGPHPGVLFGVAEQVAERLLLDLSLLGVDAAAAVVGGPNVGALFAVAAEQGIAVRTLMPDAIDELSTLPISVAAVARLRAALERGYVAIVPAEPVAFGTERLAGWWLVDPATGRTLDQIEAGHGGASVGIVLAMSPITEYLGKLRMYWGKAGAAQKMNCIGNLLGVLAGVMALWICADDPTKLAAAYAGFVGAGYRAAASGCSFMLPTVFPK